MRPALLVLCLLAGTASADDSVAIAGAAPRCASERAYCVEVRLHVAQSETGLVASQDWVLGQLGSANALFAKVGVEFELASVDALPEAAARVETREDREALGTSLGDGVIDVFVTARLGDLDHPGEEIRGVTWHRSDGRKLIILSTIAMPQVLAHELGHFFGLSHCRYKRSIMNKRHRVDPPPEERSFVAPELATMKRTLRRLVDDRVIVPAVH